MHGDLCTFRRALEAQVTQALGDGAMEDIRVHDAVNLVCRFEEIAKRCEARVLEKELSAAEWLDYHKSIGWATQQRSAYLRKLLDGEGAPDPYSRLFTPETPQDASGSTPAPSDTEAVNGTIDTPTGDSRNEGGT